MSLSSLCDLPSNIYKIYHVGKIAYVVYTGIPIWGWMAYEMYSLSKCVYFSKPVTKDPIILMSEKICPCGEKKCDCDDDDFYIGIL